MLHFAKVATLLSFTEATEMPLLSSAFGSGMVLQRSPVKAALFGWATPNASVSITMDTNTPITTMASENGKWQIELPPTSAGSGHKIRIQSDITSLNLDDVAFGEVWGCGGQSNMAYSIHMMGTGDSWKGHPSWNASEIIDDSVNYPNIRMMTVHRGGSGTPLENPTVSQPWMRASPELLNDATKWGNFSAVCYLSGRDLYNKLGGKIPVGLVSSNVGGTQIQRWLPVNVASECDASVRGSDLYQGMIAPLTKVKFKGWLWYQGEQNIGGGAPGFPATGEKFYSCEFRNMITAWRDSFAMPDMPFLFVQLAAFMDGYHYNITNQSLAELRSAQASVLDMPKTGMATAFDLGMGGGVHPGTKLEVGSRMASVMNAVAYESLDVFEGPAPVNAKNLNNMITVTFDMRRSAGWKVREGQNCSYARHGDIPRQIAAFYCKNFEVQAADGSWQDAIYKGINGAGQIEILHTVNSPVRVRYGWSDYPIVNLYNVEGFPTPPFQMDISSVQIMV